MKKKVNKDDRFSIIKIVPWYVGIVVVLSLGTVIGLLIACILQILNTFTIADICEFWVWFPAWILPALLALMLMGIGIYVVIVNFMEYWSTYQLVHEIKRNVRKY